MFFCNFKNRIFSYCKKLSTVLLIGLLVSAPIINLSYRESTSLNGALKQEANRADVDKSVRKQIGAKLVKTTLLRRAMRHAPALDAEVGHS